MSPSRSYDRPTGSNRAAAASAETPVQQAPSQEGEFLTTAQGLRLPDTDHSLKAGTRGST